MTPDIARSFNWALESLQSPRAWLVAENKRTVIVAVIDTGIDEQHPDLKPALWTNSKEIPNNGLDDDGNGFIDDIHGWNFVQNNSHLKDTHGHGTHVAGIIAAQGQLRPDIKGVAPSAQLMVLKYYDPQASGQQNLAATIRSIYYAVKMGAHIINYSGGGTERSPQEEQALRFAQRHGVLVVAAAGNEKTNTDLHGFFPAGYHLSNIISVAAHDQENQLLPISNFGIHSVHLAAPGKEIFSTLPNAQFGWMTGTSQATAFVSGIAALMWAHDPEQSTAEKIVEKLMISGSYQNSLASKIFSQRSANALRALTMSDEGVDAFGSSYTATDAEKNAWIEPVSE